MTWVAKSEKYTVPSGAMTRPSARPTIERSNVVGVLAAQLVAPEIGMFGAPSLPEVLLELLLQPSHSAGTRAKTRIGRRLLIIVLLVDGRTLAARGEGASFAPFRGAVKRWSTSLSAAARAVTKPFAPEVCRIQALDRPGPAG